MKTTTRYAIGSSLSAPKTIAIVAGRIYYMGASSSPERIFVLSVQGDAVYYYRCADLTYNRQATARVRIERWIAEDLIARGMASRLATLKTSNAPLRTPAWVPAEIARIEALIAGQEAAPEYLETYLGETITLDYDARIESALAWCSEHRDLVHAGGLTIAQASGELLAGRLYDVDTGSAGHDCVIDADSEDDALELVGEHAGLAMDADELRTKFDPWTARVVTIGGER